MLCRARVAFVHCKRQPSSATTTRPLCAFFSRAGTSPPTPAMHDISARPLRSSITATVLANCATFEQPEQEYTKGSCWSVVIIDCVIYPPPQPHNKQLAV